MRYTMRYMGENRSWLTLTTLCLCVLVITGPQTTEAAPSLASYVMVGNGSYYYFQLTFNESVTLSNQSALVIYCSYINSSIIPSKTVYNATTLIPTPPIGNYSLYMKIELGADELRNLLLDRYLLSISLDMGFAVTVDGTPSMAFSNQSPTRNFTAPADNVAPTLSSFSYDVSSGVVKLSFLPNIMFTSLVTNGITLTNNSGMTIPLAPVSSSPDPSVATYTGVQLKLPVDTIVTLATSPWIGANLSLLYVTVPAAAITNFFGTPFAAAVTLPVSSLTRDCYNLSTYFNVSTGDCQPCDPTCVTCKGPLPYPDPTSGCTDCSVVLMTGATYQCRRGTTCPDGYYRSPSPASSPVTTPGSILCLSCNSSCFQCSNSTTCTSCAALLSSQPALLLPSPPSQCCDNTSQACLACNSSCLGGCRGPLNTDCVYCRELKYVRNGTTYCLSSCLPHTYQRGVLCLTCTSNVTDVLCPPDPCWLGFEYNRDTYECQLTKQFRYIVIPATAGGGGLLVILCCLLCFLCWHCPTGGPDISSKRVYTNPTFSPESKCVVNPLLT